MRFQFMPGTKLNLLDHDMKPVGTVVVHFYLCSQRTYEVWWTYELTGEKEKIKVPEWRLAKP